MVPRQRGADHLPHRQSTPETHHDRIDVDVPPGAYARAARAEPSRVMTPLRELALLPLIEDTQPEHEGDFSRCGWFDSSLELAAGLQVIEYTDALPAGLPFREV
jgi:hypothetical protein